LLIESDAAAVQSIQANIAQVGLPGAQILRLPVEQALASAPDAPYDLVLADPPYALDAARLTGVLQALARCWLAADALVVVERDVRSEPVIWPDGLVAERERRYGETMLWYGRSAS
jgi:16S rRNA (guanine966-N2)-methyltransferase